MEARQNVSPRKSLQLLAGLHQKATIRHRHRHFPVAKRPNATTTKRENARIKSIWAHPTSQAERGKDRLGEGGGLWEQTLGAEATAERLAIELLLTLTESDHLPTKATRETETKVAS